jgi:hypothetical protein
MRVRLGFGLGLCLGMAVRMSLRVTPQANDEHHQRGGVQEEIKDVDGLAQTALEEHAPLLHQMRLGHKRGARQVNGNAYQPQHRNPVNPAHRALLKALFSGMPGTTAHDAQQNGSSRSRFFTGQTASDSSAFRPP